MRLISQTGRSGTEAALSALKNRHDEEAQLYAFDILVLDTLPTVVRICF